MCFIKYHIAIFYCKDCFQIDLVISVDHVLFLFICVEPTALCFTCYSSFSRLKSGVTKFHRGYASGLIIIQFVFTGCRAVGSVLFGGVLPSSLGAPVQAASKSSGRKNFIFRNNRIDDVNTVCLCRQYNGECCCFIFFIFLYRSSLRLSVLLATLLSPD